VRFFASPGLFVARRMSKGSTRLASYVTSPNSNLSRKITITTPGGTSVVAYDRKTATQTRDCPTFTSFPRDCATLRAAPETPFPLFLSPLYKIDFSGDGRMTFIFLRGPSTIGALQNSPAPHHGDVRQSLTGQNNSSLPFFHRVGRDLMGKFEPIPTL